MLNNIDAISQILKDTFLENSKVYQFNIPQSEHLAFGLEVKWARGLEAWELMRSLLPTTGRYPVLVWDSISDDYALDNWIWFDRQFYSEDLANGLIQSAAPDAIIAGVETADRASFLKRFEVEMEEEEEDYLWNDLTCVLEQVTGALGKGPTQAEIRKLVDDGVVRSPFQLEKWLFNWESQNDGSHFPTIDDPQIYHNLWGISGWGDEIPPRTVSLFLLPTEHSWETLAYLYWGESIGITVLMSFLRTWQQRYGAELVCNFGVSLKLRVAQRPTSINEAFQLACEHYSLAPYTLDGPGELLRDYAAGLLVVDGWELLEGH